MLHKGLEALFERYRKRGDAAALSEIFDRTSDELFKVALHLTRDPVEAEDVLQNTFLAAIDGAERYDASRPLMPWLVGILSNQAALARRRGQRVVEPERLDPRDPQDPADRAELTEFSSKLAGALDALPEPYREVLRLHLAQGKKSIDIAKELGRAPGTVRMQVHRGLDLLRAALPAGFALGAAAVLSPTSHAAMRARVVEAAIASAPKLAAAGTTSAIGTSALWKPIGLAASLVLATASVWWIGRERAPSDVTAIDVSAAAPTASPLEREAVANVRASASRAAPRSSPLAAAIEEPVARSDRRTLVGEVRGVPAEQVRGVALAVRGIGRAPWPAELVVHGNPDADGRFELDVTPLFEAALRERPLEELALAVEHPGSMPAQARIALEPRDASEFRADVTLEPAGTILGVVRTLGSSAPAEIEAAVLALRDPSPDPNVVDRVACAADGAFRLRVRDRGEHVVVVWSEGHRPLTKRASVAPGQTLDLGAWMLEPGASIEGRVVHVGELGEAARVHVQSAREGESYTLFDHRWLWSEGAFERGSARAAIERDGKFRVDGLAPGPHDVAVAHPLADPREDARGTRVVAPANDVELRLEEARIELEVLDADGVRASATVHARAHGPRRELAANGGSYALVLPPATAVTFEIDHPGHLPRTLELATPAAGEVHRETVRLTRDHAACELELRVALPEGRQARAIELDLVERAGSLGRSVTSARAPLIDGVARFASLRAGSYRAVVSVDGGYLHYVEGYAPCELELDLVPGGAARASVEIAFGGRLRVEAFDPAGQRIACSCRIYDARGEPIAVRFVARTPADSDAGPVRLSPTAPNDVYPALAAGEYEVECFGADLETVREKVVIEPRGAATVRLELARRR